MAEVIDIIHKLSYEANTGDLSKAYDTLLKHIKAIEANTKAMVDLEAVRQKADNANLERMRKLEQEIDKLKAKNIELVNSIKQTVKENDNLANSINKNTKAFNDMAASRRFFVSEENKATQATAKASIALINFNRVVQDAPYGIIGIANNIDPLLLSFQQLQKETGSTTGALGAMLKGLTGGAGIAIAVSVVTSLLVAFGDKIFNSGEEAEKAAKKQEKYRKEIEELNKALLESIQLQSDLDKITRDRQNRGAAQAQREAEMSKARGDEAIKTFQKEQEARQKELADYNARIALLEKTKESLGSIFEESLRLSSTQLQTQSPQEFRETNILNLLINQLGLSPEEALKLAKNASISFANAAVIRDMIEKEQVKLNEDVKDISNKIGVATLNFQKEERERLKKEEEERRKLEEERLKNNEKAYQSAIKDAEDQAAYNELRNETLQLIDSMIATEYEIYKLRNQTRADEGVAITKQQKEAEEKELEFNVGRLRDIRKVNEITLQINNELRKAIIAENFEKEAERVRFELAAQSLDQQRLGMRVRGQQIDPISDRPSTGIPVPNLLGAMRNEDLIEDLVTPDEKKVKEKLNQTVRAYQSFEQAIGQILNNISERQIRALDQEVQVRQQRVAQAEKIAEKGNTEILRLESERLEESEKQRREAAQRQIAINNALALSNAIVAVATTAAESGVASIATIPAVLAALVAGYSFVRSLDQSTGFKDGVIDLQGPGTEKSDSIPARLSKGESVMTAAATKKYKPLLEAMNEGLLPYTATRPNEFADKTTTKKLDAIIAAIEGNTVNVKQSLDQYGFVQSVETMQRREARRWRG